MFGIMEFYFFHDCFSYEIRSFARDVATSLSSACGFEHPSRHKANPFPTPLQRTRPPSEAEWVSLTSGPPRPSSTARASAAGACRPRRPARLSVRARLSGEEPCFSSAMFAAPAACADVHATSSPCDARRYADRTCDVDASSRTSMIEAVSDRRRCVRPGDANARF